MLKKIILFLIMSVSAFAFKISSVDFDKEISLGKEVSQEYTLFNKNNYPLRYKIGIENEPENVKVDSKVLLIPAYGEKNFKVTVMGDKIGEKSYFLVLNEEALNLSEDTSRLNIKMKYRIEHKYKVK